MDTFINVKDARNGAAFWPEMYMPITAPPSPARSPVLKVRALEPEVFPSQQDNTHRSFTQVFPRVRALPDLPVLHESSVEDVLAAQVADIDVHSCAPHGENSFFVADLSIIHAQHTRWTREMGRWGVEPFYAVKCNPDPMVLRLLAALGTGFDCASQAEIDAALSYGVDPSRIIYANPCKAGSFIRGARDAGVRLTTFDNGDELVKIARYHPRAQLVVRILTDDSKSTSQLGLKFGAPLRTVPFLLRKAHALGLDVVGVSFHVGSGCYDPKAYRDALRRARDVFGLARTIGYDFDFLDIGGGFGDADFETMVDIIGPALREYFGILPIEERAASYTSNLRIIAEPGRYFPTKAFTLATNIIAKRTALELEKEQMSVQEEDTSSWLTEPEVDDTEVPIVTADVVPSTAIVEAELAKEEQPVIMYYTNDGLYGALNSIIFDHQTAEPKVLTYQGKTVYSPTLAAPGLSRDIALAPTSLWGPTCDSIDCIRSLVHLPADLHVGDWLVFESMGAYTLCAASEFNGMRNAVVHYTIGTGEKARVLRTLLHR